MEVMHEITGEDESFVRGTTYSRDGSDAPREFRSHFSQSKRDIWCVQTPVRILEALGITADPRRAREFADLLDGDLSGFDYLARAAQDGNGEEVMKWIMGSLAAALNERRLPFSAVSTVLPADYLCAFVTALVGGEIERSFAKDIFAGVIEAPRYRTVFGTEHIVEDPLVCGGRATYRGSRLEVALKSAECDSEGGLEYVLDSWGYHLNLALLQHGEAYLVARDEMGWEQTIRRDGYDIVKLVASDPRFKAADASVIDALIEEVIAANPDNAAKVAEQPKLAQWFVGQVMKAVKSQGLPPMPATVVMEKLKARFGVPA
jgi:hypothetical protein